MKTDENPNPLLDLRALVRAFVRPGALLLLIAGLLLYGGTYLLGTFGSPVRADGVGYMIYLPAWVVHHSFGVEEAAVARFGVEVPAWTGCERRERWVWWLNLAFCLGCVAWCLFFMKLYFVRTTGWTGRRCSMSSTTGFAHSGPVLSRGGPPRMLIR